MKKQDNTQIWKQLAKDTLYITKALDELTDNNEYQNLLGQREIKELHKALQCLQVFRVLASDKMTRDTKTIISDAYFYPQIERRE